MLSMVELFSVHLFNHRLLTSLSCSISLFQVYSYLVAQLPVFIPCAYYISSNSVSTAGSHLIFGLVFSSIKFINHLGCFPSCTFHKLNVSQFLFSSSSRLLIPFFFSCLVPSFYINPTIYLIYNPYNYIFNLNKNYLPYIHPLDKIFMG